MKRIIIGLCTAQNTQNKKYNHKKEKKVISQGKWNYNEPHWASYISRYTLMTDGQK